MRKQPQGRLPRQRTVRDKFGERVTVQRADGPYFYLEVHDGQRNAWVFWTARKLRTVHRMLGEMLGDER